MKLVSQEIHSMTAQFDAMCRETTRVVREAREASINAAQRVTAAEMQGEQSQELASSLLRPYNEIVDIHGEIPLSPTAEITVDKGKGVKKRPNPNLQPPRVEEEDILYCEDDVPVDNPPLEV
jgi:restriction endonuclease Mrr